jgi:hypothetical protein
MIDELIRPEAADAYTDRWLGEVSGFSMVSPLSLLIVATVSLIALISFLFFASYSRQTTLSGVTSGATEVLILTDAEAQSLQAGKALPLQIDSSAFAGSRLDARIVSVAPVQSGVLRYAVGIELPLALHGIIGLRFSMRLPPERRHIIEWMFPLLRTPA